ncbi:neutral/alkaline non-lysosomal ceramidase N-terminal domain-containing protein [Hydrocarboniclastica marina]|uniref:Neutral ceramidase n=1 Tax=Hydrocarboniclastica marina TaxID=2259620 RepID=A0A4P7XJ96_9ALTE|nr:neutral/alkaline non-lysosomal ceramidase N-terminal domain-containing protein [Hydrocarboniclastica marina]QCF27189.1 ceramidase [Hydrocarboniclastica marina]
MGDAGWGKYEIAIRPSGYAMHGYGQITHRATSEGGPLFARSLFFRDKDGKTLIFCCLDLGYVTHAMRAGAVEQLASRMGSGFNAESFVLTCTHTHSGPGGCAHEVLYNLVTPGFQPEHLQAVVSAIVESVVQAWMTAEETELWLGSGCFDEHVPVAWNRSLRAWNRNPDVSPYREGENHKALDRRMQVLSLRRDGQVKALLSLFGVHATCLGSSLNQHNGDNKGYAAAETEARLGDGAVAIFAQAKAGDVSPHYHGPGQADRRKAIKGEAEYAYAESNGRKQSELALVIAASPAQDRINGPLDGVLTYVDFSNVHADPGFANGEPEARTSDPCHGVSFAAGTPVDGPGVAPALLPLLRLASRARRALKQGALSQRDAEERAYFRRLYRSQGPKDIFMELGRRQNGKRPRIPGFIDPLVAELNRQEKAGAIKESEMVPSVLPLQIVRLGSLALVCCPGEFTTTSGRRLIETVNTCLKGSGISQTLICTYCNEYMGYVTTYEEYQEQAYEGGHTLYGQWSLAAFQTRFAQLAAELPKAAADRNYDRATRPVPPPDHELSRRSGLPPWQ